MDYGNIPGIETPASRLAQGTIMLREAEAEKGFALLDAVFDLGINMFDTAHIYGHGANERTFGRWVNERGVRDKIVVIGKGAHPYEGQDRVTDFYIKADCHDTLNRFQFDAIDLYLLHRDNPSVPVGPIVEVLNELHGEGKVKAFGGSNWTHQRVAEANEYAEKRGLVPFAASSPNFSLAEQINPPWAGCVSISGPQAEAARAWYGETQMPLVTWSSIACGFFTGRLKSDAPESASELMPAHSVQAYCCDANIERLRRVEELAAEKELTVPQIATAYVLSRPLNIFALIGCMNGEECAQNIQAMQCKLTDAETAWLDLRSEARLSRGT